MTDEPNIKNDDRLAGGGAVACDVVGIDGVIVAERVSIAYADEMLRQHEWADCSKANFLYTEAELAALRQRCEQAERRLNEASHDAIYEAHKREQAERERDEAVGVLRHIDVLPDEPDPIARLCEARKAARRVLRKRDAALAHDAQDHSAKA